MILENSQNVCSTISPNDQMMGGATLEQYLHGGRLALNICLDALGEDQPHRIVDFPSGHGRVMRWLRHNWPKSDIYAVEVDGDALDFCSETFGAMPIPSTARLHDLALPTDVDLIWSGSLLTHFNEPMWDAFLTRTIDALRPGGMLVCTTHGRLAMMLAERRDPVFGTLIDLAPLCDEYKQTGFSYRSYDPAYPTYGLSFSSPSWVIRKFEAYRFVKIRTFREGAWSYQDAFVLEKLSTPI